MVSHPRDYRWSSYRANADGIPDPVIAAHEECRQLGWTAYRALFAAHVDAERISEIRQATNGNYALGSERFKAEIEQTLKRRATPGKSGRPTRQWVVWE